MPNLQYFRMNCDLRRFLTTVSLLLEHFANPVQPNGWERLEISAWDIVAFMHLYWKSSVTQMHVKSAMDSWDHTQCLCLRFWQGSQHTCIVHACHACHACMVAFYLIFLCAGALKTSAPHAWLVHPLWLHGLAHVCVHTNSNPTNLIAAFGWQILNFI